MHCDIALSYCTVILHCHCALSLCTVILHCHTRTALPKEVEGEKMRPWKVGDTRYEARSRGRSSPDTFTTLDTQVENAVIYCDNVGHICNLFVDDCKYLATVKRRYEMFTRINQIKRKFVYMPTPILIFRNFFRK